MTIAKKKVKEDWRDFQFTLEKSSKLTPAIFKRMQEIHRAQRVGSINKVFRLLGFSVERTKEIRAEIEKEAKQCHKNLLSRGYKAKIIGRCAGSRKPIYEYEK